MNKFKLGDICRVINGRAYKQEELLSNGKYRVLRVGNFFSSNSWYYSDLELEEDKYCNKNDLLFAWSASFGPRIWKEERAIYHYHIWKLETDKKVLDKLFLYYYLDNRTKSMIDSTHGSIMLHITKSFMENMEIQIPKILSQQKIAAVLSALDDKIELNNKVNAELEAMAKTLYDYWFVQFEFPTDTEPAKVENGTSTSSVTKGYKSSGGKMVYNKVLKREIPEGWEVTVFNDWIEKTKTGDWGKEHIEGNYTERVFCVRGADINGLNGKGEVKAPERYILKNNLSKKLEPFDFIVEISGGSPIQSTARIALLTDESFERFDTDVVCSNFCKAVTIKDNNYAFNFQQEWQRLYDAGVFFGFEGKTSGIKNFLFESFMESYHIVKPPKELVVKFNEIAKRLEKKKQSNLKQNQELAQLRDWLLPMLMNGQVTVEGTEEQVLGMVAEPAEQYNASLENVERTPAWYDQRFELWLTQEGLAARGEVDRETLRILFDAMDDHDK